MYSTLTHNPFKGLIKLLLSDKETNMETEITMETEVKEEEKRVIGRITKVDPAGWGFISSKSIKFTRIFFHWTALKQNTLHFEKLKKGMNVEFTAVETTDRGWKAIKIEVISDKEDTSTI